MSSFYDEGVWKLNIKTGSFLRTIYSNVVLDARGRKGSQLHERLETAPPSVAIWTHIPAEVMPKESRIEAIGDGWFWGSPVAGNQYRVMAFTDSDAVKGKNLSSHFSKMLGKAGLFAAVNGQLEGNDLQTCPVTSFVHTQPWDRQFIKIGEAAFTLDPLSSTGVEKAMRFAMQTAVAVHTLVRHKELAVAQAFYEEKLIESAVNHAHWTAAYYASSRFSKEHFSFWEKRINFQLNDLKVSNEFTQCFLSEI
jgi:flavin-dependent dehydrogenase